MFGGISSQMMLLCQNILISFLIVFYCVFSMMKFDLRSVKAARSRLPTTVAWLVFKVRRRETGSSPIKLTELRVT